MKSILLLIAGFSVVSITLNAQSKWGIEFKGSRYQCTNSGQLEGGHYGETIYTINEEEDLMAYSQSLGVIYLLNDRNLLKFHIANFQNGRVLTTTACKNLSNCETYYDINTVFHYIQFAPSYAYRFLNKRFIIPIEFGININTETYEYDQFFPGVNQLNFDYEISTGLDYRLDPDLILGLHGLFTGNISEYQADNVTGMYKPKEFGLEFSIIYEFGKSIDQATK